MAETAEAPAAVPSAPKVSPTVAAVETDLRYKRNERPPGPGVSSQLKIYGGKLVVPPNFADTVGIAPAGSTELLCTGTLIEPDVVLTAAHCICKHIDSRVYFGNKVGDGGSFLNVVGSQGSFSINPDGSCPSDLSPLFGTEEDFGLLLLAHPAPGVAPRQIADDVTVDKAIEFHVVGFGALDSKGVTNPHTKHEADVRAVSNDCSGRMNGDARGTPDAEAYGCIAGHEVIAGTRGVADTCFGDSGGPLLVSLEGTGDATLTTQLVLAGTTSRGIDVSQTACGSGGVYERLDALARSWIQSTIKGLRTRHQSHASAG